ncbi:putative histone deacetylase complex subunit cti6 [Podospora conica]|nr:putative histone deacetylase complex subunit cti6 [Schizothecium conicum]
MAGGIEARRSARARVAQPQSQISSTNSSLSGRTERNSRHFKAGSPPKSTSTGSLSSEPPEDTITADDTFGTTRRRTRGQGDERDRISTKIETIETANDDDDAQEEDEAVRCICGFDDYPGPPPLDDEIKTVIKESTDVDPVFPTDVTDESAGFFVQCDVCKVWQHGACVGIMTEESSPDEYFCEGCRRDLHKIFTASNGQRYSYYLPLKRPSRSASRSASLNKDGVRSPPDEKKEGRSGRASSASQASKRRSTMNSREAGYDEAEALRRAIEASKEEVTTEPGDTGPRRPKRGRTDSEEKPENVKRQRTGSRSVSPSPGKTAEDSDEGVSTRNGASKSRNGVASRSQRTEKPSEREERERQRIEAANKRKGRAERRRADGMAQTILVNVSGAYADTDSDPSEELPLAARAAANKTATSTTTGSNGAGSAPAAAPAPATVTATTTVTAPAEPVNPPPAVEPPAPSQPTTDTPSPSVIQTRTERKRSHKKKGRNQYTRDRDDEDSPARSQSRDIQKEDHAPAGHTTKSGVDHGHGKGHGKAKGGMGSKITMTDMKRKAGALLDFISRTQVELAGEALPDTSTSSPKTNGVPAPAPEKSTQGAPGPGPKAVNGMDPGSKEFKELNCIEMMDTLTRRLVKWQQEYAV